MQVLIIDDEFIILKDTERIVKEVMKDDVTITTTMSAKEALELVKKNKYEIIFSDIDMPGMKGIELSNNIEKISPDSKLIFITGYPQYSLDAWGTFAKAFLLKPVKPEDVEKAVMKLGLKADLDKVTIKCFGAFDVNYKGQRVGFARRKSFEMLAVLVDALGADVSIERIRVMLWEEPEDTEEKKAYVRQLAKDIRNTFSSLGIDDILINTVGGYKLNRDRIQCDYFDWAESGKKESVNVYMSQFEWAEI